MTVVFGVACTIERYSISQGGIVKLYGARAIWSSGCYLGRVLPTVGTWGREGGAWEFVSRRFCGATSMHIWAFLHLSSIVGRSALSPTNKIGCIPLPTLWRRPPEYIFSVVNNLLCSGGHLPSHRWVVETCQRFWRLSLSPIANWTTLNFRRRPLHWRFRSDTDMGANWEKRKVATEFLSVPDKFACSKSTKSDVASESIFN